MDDGSKDGTAGVLRTFGDSIFSAILPMNGGACAARNHGASLAKGKYLVFLDGDDVLTPWTLDVYSRIIDAQSPKIILGKCLVCEKIPVPARGNSPREIRFVDYRDFLSKDRPWVYNSSCLVVERAAFAATDGWSPSIFFQDIQDLLNKLGVAGKTALILTPVTVWYRMHNSNAILKVPSFIQGIYTLLARAKAGVYPGGAKYNTRRASWFGGLIYYWVKKSLRTGHYRDGFRLLLTGWWMILLAIVHRAVARIFGRKRVEILQLEHEQRSEPVLAIH